MPLASINGIALSGLSHLVGQSQSGLLSVNGRHRSTSSGAALPTFQTAGTAASGTGNISPTLPSSLQTDDVLVMVTESNTAEPVTPPSGWTDLSIPSGNGASQLGMFWRRVGGINEAGPMITDTGDHTLARIIAIRGCLNTGSPWDVTTSNKDIGGGGTTSLTITGATTTVANTLVVVSCSLNGSSANPVSGWTNANLSSITERIDDVTLTGNTGCIGAATGGKVAAGSIGNTTLTCSSSASFGGQFCGALLGI